MGSPYMHEFAAARTQNLYARRSNALCSLSVTLMHAMCIRVALKAWRSVTLSEHLATDEIYRRGAANLFKSGGPFLH
jgi:hypothetical protein